VEGDVPIVGVHANKFWIKYIKVIAPPAFIVEEGGGG
jgi:hypothetical protein